MNMKVNLAGVEWNNPVTTASGTFGSGAEYGDFVDLNRIGAVTTKGVANIPWAGNPTPRVAETASGMLNAIGLQNPGVEEIIRTEIPFLEQYDTCIIANIAGSTAEEYIKVAKSYNQTSSVHALELNISCPNVKEGGIQFGTNCDMAADITKAVKEVSDKPVYVKLSPNVTNIVEMALAVEAAGADGITMINTLTGMQIDLARKRPLLANLTGGLSGAAIKPVAIKMVYEVSQQVSIPIIGMGGVQNAEDVLEFLLAGASAVAVGTANFQNPFICSEIIDQLPQVLQKYGFNTVKEAIGKGII